MHIAVRHHCKYYFDHCINNLRIFLNKCTPGYSLLADLLDQSDSASNHLAQWVSDALVVRNSSKICLTLDLVHPSKMAIMLFQGVGNDGRFVSQTIFDQHNGDKNALLGYPQSIKGQFELNLLSSDLVRVQIVIMTIEKGRVNNVDIQPNACQSTVGRFTTINKHRFFQIYLLMIYKPIGHHAVPEFVLNFS